MTTVINGQKRICLQQHECFSSGGMNFFKTNTLTRISGLIIIFYVMMTLLSGHRWNVKGAVISSDVKGYYGYLPATFIYNDLKFKDMSVYLVDDEAVLWVNDSDPEHRFIKYTYGMSLLYSPFFLAGHAYAKIFGYEANGYSTPYRFALVFSAFFYFVMGLIFLSRFLLMQYKDHVVASVLLVIYFGTNAFYYYTNDMTLSHGYSMAMISIFLYLSAKWLSEGTFKRAFWIGLVSGIFVLVRPIDIVFLLMLPLYGVNSIKGIKERFIEFWKRKYQIILMIIMFSAVLIPQILYLRYATGNGFSYSYTDEAFFFLDPHLYDILFSYRNGWLVYSPVMILSLIGMLFLRRSPVKVGLFVVVVSLIYYYIIASWWCWWYAGFGNRAFINLYPILAISLACFFSYIYTKGLVLRAITSVLIGGSVLLCLFQTIKFSFGTLHWGSMTKEAYWDGFGKPSPSQLYESYLRHPDNDLAKKGIDAVYEPIPDTIRYEYLDFEKDHSGISGGSVRKGSGRKGSRSYHVPGDMEFALNYKVPARGADHILTSIWIKGNGGVNLVLSHANSELLWNGHPFPYQKDGEWHRVLLYSYIREEIRNDTLNLSLWNTNGVAYDADNVKIIWIKEELKLKYLE